MMNSRKMVEAAKASVPAISPEEALRLMDETEVLLLDVRDHPEVEKTGVLKGARHISRGMLEFRADPESPSRDEAFSRDKTIIVYCASGGRSALAGLTLQQLGYEKVFNLGGFKDAAASGLPVDGREG